MNAIWPKKGGLLRTTEEDNCNSGNCGVKFEN